MKNTEFEQTPQLEASYPHLNTLETYQGISQRFQGYQRAKEVLSDFQAVTVVEPIVMLQTFYYDWQKNGITPTLLQNLDHIWKELDGEHNPLIARRLFPDAEGIAKDGPRSGNITSKETLLVEVVKVFEYYQVHYKPENVLPEIMVHKLVDSTQPPLQTEPMVPFGSGDVIPASSHRFQVRGTFGADESVQGFPTDCWEVSFEPGGHVKITQKRIARKTQSMIPAEGVYQTFEIPAEFQDVPSLRYAQIINIAQVCKRVSDLFGSHRLEFDGTSVHGFNILSIIECAPFKILQNTPEAIAKFASKEVVLPITIMEKPEDIGRLSDQEKEIVYINPTFFRGNEQRDLLTSLTIEAAIRHKQLAVLASGNTATQHAVQLLHSHEHIIKFVEDERFSDQESIRIYPIYKEDVAVNIDWEREDPLVFRDKIVGRGVDKIGGKARGLLELQRYDFNIPNWGVIETSVFRRLLSELDPERRLALLDNVLDAATIQKETAPIQRAIESYDHNFLSGIDALLEQIGGSRWAVRSSATCEDGQEVSFAGVFKSALNINRENISRAVKLVINSALEPKPILLARVSGIKPSDVKMAVVVQKMVDAQAAGTIFTVDAASRRRDAVRIEANDGLGVGIVDGTAKSPLILQIARSNGSVIESKAVYQKKPILTQDQINQLLKLGLEVEKKLQEGPQDIEWAIDRQGIIWLLQTRPVTNIK